MKQVDRSTTYFSATVLLQWCSLWCLSPEARCEARSLAGTECGRSAAVIGTISGHMAVLLAFCCFPNASLPEISISCYPLLCDAQEIGL